MASPVSPDVVPVFDPEHDALKAVPADQAKHFADMGYAVGDNAKNRMLQNSSDAKLGSFLTSFGNIGSAGLFNLGLAATGRTADLKNEARAQEANSGSALAGNVAGFVGSTIAAPLALGGKAAIGGAYALGGIGERALAYGADRGGLVNLLAKGANLGLQGAPAVAAQSISDTVTENAILDHPLTAQQLASNAIKDVVWNAGFLGATHGILNLPKAIRKGAGNALDRLEEWSALKAKYVKAAEEAATGEPRVTSATQVFDREYAAPSTASDAEGLYGLALPEKKAAEATGKAMGRLEELGHDIPQSAGLPNEIAETLSAEPISAATKVSPELEPVPQVEKLSVKRARLKAEQAGDLVDNAIASKPLNPEDFEPAFEWPAKYKQGQKLHVLRGWIKDAAAASDKELPGIWDRVQELENEAQAIAEQHALAVKRGEEGIPNHKNLIAAKWAEKAQLKELLEEMVPATYDAETKTFTPGFKDLNAEYARIVNPSGNLRDLERPAFVSKASRQADIEAQLHANAVAKAEKADAHVKLLESHHEELRNRAAVIERNKLAKAADKAAEKQIREEAKAEAKAAAAKAKAEKDAAVKAAREARQAEQKAAQEARAAHAKVRAEMPKADAAAPKSAKSQSFTAESQTAEGLRRDTFTRKEVNGRIKEKHRVVIKAPKVPPKMDFAGYETPFKSGHITAAAVGGWIPGVGPLANAAAIGMGAANAFTAAASHRASIGKMWQKVMGGLAKGIAMPLLPAQRVYKASTRGTRSEEAVEALNPADYQHVVKSVSYLNSNPQAVQGYMDDRYPHVRAEHPKVHQNMVTATMRALAALHEQMPKKPYDPTLYDVDFTPTRAQQIETLRHWNLLANPALGLQYASPRSVRLLEQAYPALLQHQRDLLTQQIHANDEPMNGRTARQVSTYLGANVRPLDDAATLKRLQETAGPEPMQQQKGGGGGLSGGSSKVTNQAVQRDMPSDGLYQLGG